ncbi:hypothetical protein HDU96_006155 [Phlyctochytrium bullatum]|nr:hypothetical protein HDU96_006155 [Phlyctochytrium bullatum]
MPRRSSLLAIFVATVTALLLALLLSTTPVTADPAVSNRLRSSQRLARLRRPGFAYGSAPPDQPAEGYPAGYPGAVAAAPGAPGAEGSPPAAYPGAAPGAPPSGAPEGYPPGYGVPPGQFASPANGAGASGPIPTPSYGAPPPGGPAAPAGPGGRAPKSDDEIASMEEDPTQEPLRRIHLPKRLMQLYRRLPFLIRRTVKKTLEKHNVEVVGEAYPGQAEEIDMSHLPLRVVRMHWAGPFLGWVGPERKQVVGKFLRVLLERYRVRLELSSEGTEWKW